MAEIAQECIARNKQQHAVHLRPMASTALKIGRDLPSKMKVLVSEIVDSQLLGEGILPTLRHAMVRPLEEWQLNTQACLTVCPFCVDVADGGKCNDCAHFGDHLGAGRAVRDAVELGTHAELAADQRGCYGCMRGNRNEGLSMTQAFFLWILKCGGSGLLHDIQIDMLADAVTPLCAPVVAFEFDLRYSV